MGAREDAYINKIPYGIAFRLNRALDPGDMWEELLGNIQDNQLDSPPFDSDFRGILNNCHLRRQSPTEKLLNELGNRGYRVMHLKHWLRLAGLQRALDILEGRDSTTGAQTDRVSDSQSRSYGRFNSYSGQDNPRSYPQPTPTTPTGPITGGQTIVSDQRYLTPYDNTGEGDLSDGDDVGGGGTRIELGQSSVSPYRYNQEHSSHQRRRRTAVASQTPSVDIPRTGGQLSDVREPTIRHKHSLVDYNSVPPNFAAEIKPSTPDHELNKDVPSTKRGVSRSPLMPRKRRKEGQPARGESSHSLDIGGSSHESGGTVVQHIPGSSSSVHDLQEHSLMEFNRMTPSDVGLLRVAKKIGSCDELAVELGIPLSHITSIPDGSLKGSLTLAYWRDGRGASSFHTTWGFLLEKVEGVCGRNVAEELRETLSKDPACAQMSPPLNAQ